MTVLTRDLTTGELRELRERFEAGRAEGAVMPAPPPRPEQSAPLPDLKPQAPDVVYRQMMAHLQKWARASKAEWMIAMGLFRKENPTMVAHMTDEQLMLMLQSKIERAIKEAYGSMGRGRELQIKTGGY